MQMQTCMDILFIQILTNTYRLAVPSSAFDEDQNEDDKGDDILNIQSELAFVLFFSQLVPIETTFRSFN